MKNFVLWLIKVFKLDITTTKTVEKEVFIKDYVGDVHIDGNLTVKGNLYVSGEITCFKCKKYGSEH